MTVARATAGRGTIDERTLAMVSRKVDPEHHEDTCPACPIRLQLTVQLAASPASRRRLLDELLDAVEAVRWVDTASGRLKANAGHEAAVAVMGVAELMYAIADDATRGDG